MPKPAYLIHDTLDDRREVHYLLSRLPPRRRLQWLAWCCQRATLPHSATRPAVARRSTGGTLEVFLDFWTLCAQYDLDADAALDQLVALVRSTS